ncbi:hypothetical protein [Hymenobacter edaphi]|uniref:Uncharacterized protein n=1 Tax=Hymenobacter edaphi TaxID=2211146 RepID=A0A328B6G9_9BACT|nr:hypothetical protein [Hymenobacter edaphi]RAK62703.1 hypothetical protein DLM85_22820 [Hymenobacter edaphi]
MADPTRLQWLVAGAYYVLDYYPTLLGLIGLCSLWRPASDKRLLPGLNLLTAAAGLLNLLGWSYELFVAWYSQVEFEQYAFVNRATGPYWWAYWSLLLPRIGSQCFWWPRPRRSWRWSFGYAVAWVLLPVLERSVIILSGWHRDYLPSSWGMFSPDGALRWLFGALALSLLLWLRPWHTRQR